ncbi:TonB-dependent receptor [Pseudomonadota bacterium]
MKVLTVLFISTAMLASSLPVQAQTTDEMQESGLLEEVMVTAQRREQSTMDVPISVMVFNQDTIEQNNMKGAANYLLMTPNVNFREDGRGGHGSINIAIRGISDLAGGERVQATQAMGFYWDEFSVATIASGTANPPVYDVESIEVLRGPQGTYFGRNAEGGAINIQTIKPSQEFYGQVDLGYGRFDTYEVSGVLNLPIGDNFALRTVFNNEKSDGFVDNIYETTGGSSDYELNGVRTKLRWTPNDQAIVDLGVAYYRNEQGYAPMVATCVDPTFGFDPSDPDVLGGIPCSEEGEGSQTYQNTLRNSVNETTLLTANITYDWDTVRLTSITGQIKTDFDQLLDLDHSGIDSVDRKNDYTTTSTSSELRLSSFGDNTIDWTAVDWCCPDGIPVGKDDSIT